VRKIWIAVADQTRGTARIENVETEWVDLLKRLLTPVVTKETYEEYMASPRDTQLAVKDVGGFIGGKFSGTQRRKDELEFRDLICLDLDHLAEVVGIINLIREAFKGYVYAVHTTHKHSNGSPRLRLVFPMSRRVSLVEYEPVARGIAQMLDLELFDDTTFQPARVMFWPSHSTGADWFAEDREGEWLNPDYVLATIDVLDPFTWPVSSRNTHAPRLADERVEYAPGKKGVIGAFCRAFDIHQAIGEFDLPYSGTTIDERYTYDAGSSAEGAIVYDFGTQLYSHHESDPAFGLHNAFDLVRIHKYGELDSKGDEGNKPTSWPSYKAMVGAVADLPEVKDELAPGETRQEIVFDDLTAGEGPAGPPEFDEFLVLIASNQIDLERAELFAAAGNYTPTQLARIAGTIVKQYKDNGEAAPAKADVLATIKRNRRDLVGTNNDDAQRQLAEYILEKVFDNGDLLFRTGQMFWTFERGLWAPDDDERIGGMIQDEIVRLKEGDPEGVEHLLAYMADRDTTTITAAILLYIRQRQAALTERDDPLNLMRNYETPVINCSSCTLWVDKNGKIQTKEHDPADRFTIRVDTSYDPAATCPLWDEFIRRAFSDTDDPEEMVRHVEELCGYAMQMSRWIKLWVLFLGPTNTGKTTVQSIISQLLGGAVLSRSLSDSAWQGQFAYQSLIGKLVITEDDMERSHTLDDGLIKRLSENKEITAEIKFKESVRFISRAFFMINSNHPPRVRDISTAMRDRAQVIPFTFNFVDEGIADDRKRMAMYKELPGIFNRFLAGLQRLRMRGHLDVPDTCEEAKNNWLSRANPITAFCSACVSTADAGVRLKASEVWDAYRVWYREEYGPNGGSRVSRSETYAMLDHVLGQRIKSNGSLCYKGWVLSTTTEDLDPGDTNE